MTKKNQSIYNTERQFHLRIPKGLFRRIEDCMSQTHKSMNQFIISLIENQLFTEKGFASYMVRQKKLEAAYWEYQFEKADNKDMFHKEVKLDDYIEYQKK